MQFIYDSTIDLVCAFFIWTSWERLEQSGFKKKIPDDLQKWIVESDKNLPLFVKEEGKNFSADFFLFIFSLLKIIHCEKIESCKNLLDRINCISVLEFCEYMIRGEGFSCDAKQLLSDPSSGEKYFDQYSGTVRPREKENFLNFLNYPSFYIRQIHSLLSLFFETCYSRLEVQLSEQMKDKLDQDKLDFSDDPQLFMSDRFYLDSQEGNVPETAYLSWFDFADVIFLEDPHIIIYGWQNSGRESEISPEEVYSLLNDETRRSIIRELVKRPMYSREIAAKWKLSPSTVSYHMGRLYELALVKHKNGERRRIYYYLDNDRLEFLFNIIRRDLI